MRIGIVLSTVRKNWLLLKVVLFHSNQFCYTVDGNFPVFIPDSKRFFEGFQMIYHLFLSSYENMLKKVKMSERESACTKIYVRQCSYLHAIEHHV